jgi:predicted alpha/beta-hydrolase family hydrolase
MTIYPAVATTRTSSGDASRCGTLLVLAHGAGGGQHHPFMVRYARGLAERGIDVVTFDFAYVQAGRKSPDKAPVLEETFRRVIAEASGRNEFKRHRLFIGGKSMGGRMATHLAADRTAWPVDALPLAGVIVFGYPLKPIGSTARGAANRPAQDRVSHLAKITVPTLIVQGTRDSFGGPDDVKAAMPQAHVHGLVGADHSPAPKFDHDVWDRVAAFASST